jgi:hypothetical protein
MLEQLKFRQKNYSLTTVIGRRIKKSDQLESEEGKNIKVGKTFKEIMSQFNLCLLFLMLL